ncbi:hypothetical protein BC943DRAFT_326388 [Umbelopsis sp. AD052]|nr:hypothetical protein BC943DRAFT_326388 [Umbelopsis sp. AD052]
MTKILYSMLPRLSEIPIRIPPAHITVLTNRSFPHVPRSVPWWHSKPDDRCFHLYHSDSLT